MIREILGKRQCDEWKTISDPMSQSREYEVFRHTTNLVAVTTGDVINKINLLQVEETGKIIKTISIKADTDLLGGVVEVWNLNALWMLTSYCKECFPQIPLSLATPDRKLRYVFNKSDLSNILQENILQNKALSNQKGTCAIIDGMAPLQFVRNRSGKSGSGVKIASNILSPILLIAAQELM